MLSMRLAVSPAAALLLTIAGQSYAQMPPPPPPAAPGELMAELQNPPRPPNPPRVPSPPPPRGPRNQDRRPAITEPFSQTFKVGANSALLVINTRGTIAVAAAGAGQIDVSATKSARGSNDEEAKRRLAEARIDVHSTANRVELRSEQERGGIEVDFTIKVPPDCAVDLRSVSGDIRVVNVKGELRTQSINGDVTLDGTSRIASIKTVSGDVQITNGGGDASLSLSTVTGDVVASGLAARGLDFSTVDGDFRVTGWTGERVTARSLSGDFEVNGSLAKGGRYDLESHSGNVRFVLAEQPGFEIEANTFSGNIAVDFSIKTEGPVRTSGGGRNPRSVRGTYGDGSASLHVQTFSGDISVSRK
jgi:putative adhesin